MRAAALSAAALALAATAPATDAARLAAKTVADTLTDAPKVSVQWYTEALCTSRAARPAHPPHTTGREAHQGVPTAGHAAQRRAARRAASRAVAPGWAFGVCDGAARRRAGARVGAGRRTPGAARAWFDSTKSPQGPAMDSPSPCIRALGVCVCGIVRPVDCGTTVPPSFRPPCPHTDTDAAAHPAGPTLHTRCPAERLTHCCPIGPFGH